MPIQPPSPAVPRSKIVHLLAAVLLAIVIGTAGYCVLEGWSITDALYMTVMTLTTVGFGEVHPLSYAGQLFTIFLMLAGVGVVIFALTSFVQIVIQSEMLDKFGTKRRYREMNKLNKHMIICGAGRVGSHIIRDIRKGGYPFVVIERNEEKVNRLLESGVQHVIAGDATLEEVLRIAGVERARALVACLPDDADNVYTVLVARDLNRGLHIVARAVEEQAQTTLLRAGANRVVAPTIMGGRRLALAMLKPAVDDFFDSLSADELDIEADQVGIQRGSVLAGKKLRETNLLSVLNIIVVSITHSDGRVLFNPDGDAVVNEGDTLIAIGTADALERLEREARTLARVEGLRSETA
jgi:voltage-gated potassium channel